MSLTIVDAAAVRQLLPLSECVTLMERAFAAVSSGHARQPIRQVVPIPGGIMGWMPGVLSNPDIIGLKVMTVVPRTDQGSHRGLVVLFDCKSGSPKAIIDGAAITTIRTAAASAAATRILARPDVRTLAVFGAGEQARAHLQAMKHARQFDHIVLWARDRSRAERVAAEISAELGQTIEVEYSAEAAVTRADVLCTTTSAKVPFLKGIWLRAGQHLNVVGSSGRGSAEIDAKAVRRSTVFVDHRENALALSDELTDSTNPLTEVGEVLVRKALGRTTATQITLFKSLGMAVQDLIAAEYVLKKYRGNAPDVASL